MTNISKSREGGFSLLELLVSMTIMLVLMGTVSMLFSRSMGVKNRESRKTDALTSAQAVLNIISREIANSGFGIYNPAARTPTNGIVLADSGAHQIRVRSNITNTLQYSAPNAGATSDPGEDVTYYLDAANSSIVRYDANAIDPVPKTSVVVNRISNITFEYVNYTAGSSATTTTSTPTSSTGRVIITVVVQLDPVSGQQNPGTVTFTSDVILRNANYMLQQY